MGMPELRDVQTQEFRNSDGQVPKWTKGADCKSVAIGFQGSNPCLPTTKAVLRTVAAYTRSSILSPEKEAGVAQW